MSEVRRTGQIQPVRQGHASVLAPRAQGEPRGLTVALFAQIDEWRVVRQRGPGCLALQMRARVAVGYLSDRVHQIERNGDASET